MKKPIADPYKAPATISSDESDATEPIVIDDSFSSMFKGTFSIFLSSIRTVAFIYAFYLALSYALTLMVDRIAEDLSSSIGFRIFVLIVWSAAYPAAMFAMKETAEKGRPTSGLLSSLRKGVVRLWAILRASLFLGLFGFLAGFFVVIMIGIHPLVGILFMIGAAAVTVVFAVKWSIAFPFIVFEQVGIIDSFRYSSVCVSGRFGRVFAVATVVFLLSMLMATIFGVLFFFLMERYQLEWWTSIPLEILQHFSSFLLYGLFASMSVAFYRALRHRKDELKEKLETADEEEETGESDRDGRVVACTFVDRLMAEELKAELEVAGAFSLIEERENETYCVLVDESDLKQARFLAELLRNSSRGA